MIAFSRVPFTFPAQRDLGMFKALVVSCLNKMRNHFIFNCIYFGDRPAQQNCLLTFIYLTSLMLEVAAKLNIVFYIMTLVLTLHRCYCNKFCFLLKPRLMTVLYILHKTIAVCYELVIVMRCHWVGLGPADFVAHS